MNVNKSILSGLAIFLTLLFLFNGVSVYAATVYHGYFRMYVRSRHYFKCYKAKTVFTVDISEDTIKISSSQGSGSFHINRVRHYGNTIIYYISGSGVFKGYSLSLKGLVIQRGSHIFIVLHTPRRANLKATVLFSGRP